MAAGTMTIKKVIYLALLLLFVAYTVPYAAWQIAIASWSSLAYASIFTVLITLAAGFVVCLIALSYARS